MTQLRFDKGMAERLETIYRSRDILRRRRLVHDALGAATGQRVLDLGCGPGFYTAELAERVGPTGGVVGIDASADNLAAAESRCEQLDNVELHLADATSVPAADASVDAALCVQVLEYVPDVAAALAEVRRVLRPGGRFVVWDIDWSTVSWHSDDPERMSRLLRAWDAHLAHPSLPRTLAPELRAAGFADVRTEGHAFATTELTPDAYGGALVPLVEQFVGARDDVRPDDASAWAAEQRRLGERGEFFFACVQFCFTAT